MIKIILSIVGVGLLVLGVVAVMNDKPSDEKTPSDTDTKVEDYGPGMEKAIFAGGCFWCMESPFEHVDGVKAVISGYTGGLSPNPSYEEVSGGGTGHLESIEVIYDPAKVTYQQLLDIYWRQIDPTDAGGQFVDRGNQYRPAIFYRNDEQRELAEESKAALAASGRFDHPISVEILPAGKFYPAEEYHQDYYEKNPVRYKGYRAGSGRDQFINKFWGPSDKGAAGVAPSVLPPMPHGHNDFVKPSQEELKKKLTPLQCNVTQENGTEQAFHNQYWDNHRDGIYVDVVSGEVLFSSKDKFDSGTGWPSFTKPLVPGDIVEKTDRSMGLARTEVRSKRADSHLGHVFNDGPPPTGLRYCMNSAAMRFIPKEDLEKEGYGEYTKLFK